MRQVKRLPDFTIKKDLLRTEQGVPEGDYDITGAAGYLFRRKVKMILRLQEMDHPENEFQLYCERVDELITPGDYVFLKSYYVSSKFGEVMSGTFHPTKHLGKLCREVVVIPEYGDSFVTSYLSEVAYYLDITEEEAEERLTKRIEKFENRNEVSLDYREDENLL